MKFRLIAVTAALLAFVYLAPACFAGDKDSTTKPSTPAATAPVEPAATRVSHDGGIDDLDAIVAVANRNRSGPGDIVAAGVDVKRAAG